MDGLNAQVSQVENHIPRFASRRMAPQKPRLRARIAKRIPLMLFVILPTVLAGIYLFGLCKSGMHLVD